MTDAGTRAQICLDLPDNRDWLPEAVIIHEGQTIAADSWSLLNGKDPATYAGSHRCYTFHFPFRRDNDDAQTLVIEIERLTTSIPEVLDAAACETAAQKIHDERGVEVDCAPLKRLSGKVKPIVIKSPQNMTEQQAHQLLDEMLRQQAVASWRFTIELPPLTPIPSRTRMTQPGPATLIPPTATATPTRNFTNTPTATPPPQENAQPRWKQYESALIKAFLPSGSGHCKWTILGQQEDKVYVWAYCISNTIRDRSRVSAPAVIRLSPNGEIEKVKIPSEGIDYGESIRKLFPPEVQLKIFDSHKPQPAELGTPLP